MAGELIRLSLPRFSADSIREFFLPESFTSILANSMVLFPADTADGRNVSS